MYVIPIIAADYRTMPIVKAQISAVLKSAAINSASVSSLCSRARRALQTKSSIDGGFRRLLDTKICQKSPQRRKERGDFAKEKKSKSFFPLRTLRLCPEPAKDQD
jgi:hypothetical protein